MSTALSWVPKHTQYLNIDVTAMATVKNPSWSVRFSPAAIRAMLRCARQHNPLECQGTLLYRMHDTDNVEIPLVVPPGPKAEFTPNTCLCDMAFANRWHRRVWDRVKFSHVGFFHTHPFEDYPLPSWWDLCGMDGYEGSDGWFEWDKQAYGGKGHFEAIIGREAFRLWHVWGDGMQLILEHPEGINRKR